MIFFIANWKAHIEKYNDAINYVNTFIKNKLKKEDKIIICPPAPFLGGLVKVPHKSLEFGVQDISPFEGGSHTGEVTVKMAKSAGANFVILGHSEMRECGETNEIIGEKLIKALKGGLTPILCVGEKERDRDGEFFTTLQNSLCQSLGYVPKSKISKIIIAYEPVWAIGKNGVPLSAPMLAEMVMFLRKVIADLAGIQISKKIKIIYGGSVDITNVKELFVFGGVSGFLVGRASLKPKDFFTLITKIHEKS